MKKTNVLRKNWQFQDIIRSSKQHVSSSLILYYQKKEEKNIRIGVSVSKKFANAVGRNKYKRQTKSILDIVKPWDLPYDTVLILRKSFLSLDYDKKITEIRKIFERLR